MDGEEKRKVATDNVVKPKGRKTFKWLRVRRMLCSGRGEKKTKWPRILSQSRKGLKTAKCYGDCHAVVGEENSGHRDSREVEGPENS